MLNMRVENFANARVIFLSGNLDAQSSEDLASLLDGFLLVGISSIVLDLSGIETLTSAAQRVIFDAYRRIISIGTMVVSGINAEIEQLLLLTGVAKHVQIFESLELALKALSQLVE